MVASEPLLTSRLQDFDYGQPGLYYVTICTHSRVPWFGEVDPSGMRLSEIGHAAQAAWNAVPDHFPDVCLDECCVMPDHVHGLLEITAPAVRTSHTVRTSPTVGTQNFASLRWGTSGNRFGPQSRNLASIVRGFKIGVTKFARGIDPAFRWQPRYWDRVVRGADECDWIRRYIRNNPAVWWHQHESDAVNCSHVRNDGL